MAAEQVSLLTAFTAPAEAPPDVESGHIVLFPDDNWNESGQHIISLDDYTAGKHHTLPWSTNDSATWLAFNLPVGTVATMTRDVPDNSSRKVADLANCGSVIDLVGSGKTVAVDLGYCSLNDSLSSFFWRQVDLEQGAVELFADKDFAGPRTVIFLSEWPREKLISVKGWDIDDRLSSARWLTLDDRQTFSLFENDDGSGRSYENIKGGAHTCEVASLDEIGSNDKMTSFTWTSIAPVKEVVAEFKVNPTTDKDAMTYTGYSDYSNGSDRDQTHTVKLSQEITETVTVTTTDKHVAGVEVKHTATGSAGIEGVGKLEVTMEIGLKYEYTHESSSSRTTTKTQTIELTEDYVIPPHKHCYATLTVSMGTVPEQEYHTTATRWYDVPMKGAERDPTNNNWYKRVENVTFWVEGSLTSASKCVVTQTDR